MRETIAQGPVSSSSPEFTSKGVSVSRTPPSDMEITDNALFFSIFTDGFQAYDSFSRGDQSYFAVISRLQNCNSYDALSLLFTRFVTILAEGEKKDKMGKLNRILLLLSDLGKQGFYVVANKRCHHFRWCIQSICGDIIAQQDINSESGKLSSVHHCLFGDCQKWRYEPLIRSYQQFNHPSSLKRIPLSVEVTPPFVFSGDGDFYSNLSLVANMNSNTGVADVFSVLNSNGKTVAVSEDTRISLETAFNDLRMLLDSIATENVLFWKGPETSMEQNRFRRASLIEEYSSVSYIVSHNA